MHPPLSHLLVTSTFRRVLPREILQKFGPNRCLNVHPALLPAYRGAAPIQHALLDNQAETGVSVLEMQEFEKGVDAGQIFGQTRHVRAPS